MHPKLVQSGRHSQTGPWKQISHMGAQVGDSIFVKNVREEWDGQWQHHYKIIIVSHLDTKCATCGFHPTECICDDPVV